MSWMTSFYALKPIGVEINPSLLAAKHLKGAFDPARNTIILKKRTIDTPEDMSVIWHEFTEKIAPWLKHPGQSIDLRGMPKEEQEWAPYAKGGKMSVGAGDAVKESEIPFDFEFRVGSITVGADTHVADARLNAVIKAGNVDVPVFDDIYDVANQVISLADDPKGALEVKPKNKIVLQVIKTAGTAQEFRWFATGWRRWNK